MIRGLARCARLPVSRLNTSFFIKIDVKSRLAGLSPLSLACHAMAGLAR